MLEFEQFNEVTLKHCPCVLELLDQSTELFVVGTYELDEELQGHETHDNNRRGSLALLRDARLITELKCTNGGVFDLKVVSRSKILVAHANGHLASYSIEDDIISLLD